MSFCGFIFFESRRVGGVLVIMTLCLFFGFVCSCLPGMLAGGICHPVAEGVAIPWLRELPSRG